MDKKILLLDQDQPMAAWDKKWWDLVEHFGMPLLDGMNRDNYAARYATDHLASSPEKPSPDSTTQKQTISVKSISVPGVSGVLETEADVDNYVDALRGALVRTLDDGKRISL